MLPAFIGCMIEICEMHTREEMPKNIRIVLGITR
jgi:hypothetical protein